MLNLELAIFADQDYDKFTDETTCLDKRKAASKIVSINSPIDGEWSNTGAITAKLTSQGRAKLYYFEVLDCSRKITEVYRTGQFPRVMTKVSITTEKGTNQFSYEDMGSL